MSYPRFLWTYRKAIRASVWRLTCILILVVLDRPKRDTPSLYPRGWRHT